MIEIFNDPSKGLRASLTNDYRFPNLNRPALVIEAAGESTIYADDDIVHVAIADIAAGTCTAGEIKAKLQEKTEAEEDKPDPTTLSQETIAAIHAMDRLQYPGAFE